MSFIFQGHHISGPVDTEGRNCTAGCAPNQSEKLLIYIALQVTNECLYLFKNILLFLTVSW